MIKRRRKKERPRRRRSGTGGSGEEKTAAKAPIRSGKAEKKAEKKKQRRTFRAEVRGQRLSMDDFISLGWETRARIARTRHNAGFMALERLAERCDANGALNRSSSSRGPGGDSRAKGSPERAATL
jgi:hypothetical protein